MNYLRTDQYTHISRDCPVNVELHKVDDIVEIAIGQHRFDGDTLRLMIDHQDACARLIAALVDACDQLITHRHSKADPDPNMPQLDTGLSGPLAS